MILIRIAHSLPPFLLTTVTTASILYVTLTSEPLPDINMNLSIGIDKIAHFLMMFGLTGIMSFDFLRLKRYKTEYRPPVILICALAFYTAAFGGIIELVQGAQDLGRSDDIADFIADCIGSLIAVPVTVALWPTVVRWYRMSDKK